jgi:hypothetical protein
MPQAVRLSEGKGIDQVLKSQPLGTEQGQDACRVELEEQTKEGRKNEFNKCPN